jgi:hypothetical protein
MFIIIPSQLSNHPVRYATSLVRQHLISSSVFKSGTSSLIRLLSGYRKRKSVETCIIKFFPWMKSLSSGDKTISRTWRRPKKQAKERCYVCWRTGFLLHVTAAVAKGFAVHSAPCSILKPQGVAVYSHSARRPFDRTAGAWLGSWDARPPVQSPACIDFYNRV